MSSKAGLIDFATGDEAAYQDKYLEDKVLGEGEFGVVHLVFDVKAGRKSEPLASKTLKKGMTFKDNTIYSPLKPEVLRRECKILKTLGGDQYVLKLLGIYESASLIHVVTEYCAGGEMIEYVTKFYGTGGGMRTEDVSRISYQLLTAVDHCAKHGIIHRDIKVRYFAAGCVCHAPGQDLSRRTKWEPCNIYCHRTIHRLHCPSWPC